MEMAGLLAGGAAARNSRIPDGPAAIYSRRPVTRPALTGHFRHCRSGPASARS
ncbi:MAG TPA: hypothetical protein VF940_06500 [Streptosporangiaceae bacterium]